MDTLTSTKSFTSEERELIALLYSCPLGEPANNCVLYQVRDVIKSDYQNTIDRFEKEKILEILSEHEKCLFNRVKSKDLKRILKNNRNFYREIDY